MKSYHDKWGCYITEKETIFYEDGGYVMTVTMNPKSLLMKILLKLRLITPSIIMVEVCEDFRETINVNLNSKKHKPGSYTGIFSTTKGEKILKISINPDYVYKWDVNVSLERVFN